MPVLPSVPAAVVDKQAWRIRSIASQAVASLSDMRWACNFSAIPVVPPVVVDARSAVTIFSRAGGELGHGSNARVTRSQGLDPTLLRPMIIKPSAASFVACIPDTALIFERGLYTIPSPAGQAAVQGTQSVGNTTKVEHVLHCST